MWRVPPARAWGPAVGAPHERIRMLGLRLQRLTCSEIVVQSRLPVLHELCVVGLCEFRNEPVSTRAKACMRVSYLCLTANWRCTNPNGQTTCSYRGSDLQHLNKAAFWFVSRDVPNRIGRLCCCCEDAVCFSHAAFRNDKNGIPALNPVGLSYRAQQRKDPLRRSDKALRVGSSDSKWFLDLHRLVRRRAPCRWRSG